MALRRRVVVTGIGAVTAFGWGADIFREGLQSGKTAIANPKVFETRGHRTHLAAEVPCAPPSVSDSIERWNRLSQADRFAVAAAKEAVKQSNLEIPANRTGVFFGGSTAGMQEFEDWFSRLIRLRPEPPVLRLLASQQLNGPGDEVARTIGAEGPVQSYSSACTSAGLAIGSALDAVRCGEVDIAITGGSDSLCQLTYGGFNSLRSVDTKPCRPFSSSRAGLSLGEGAGVLVLETLECAAARAAVPLAEILGFGASCDAHHMTAPQPEGEGILSAMNAALADAELSPTDVSFINSHGTATAHNDPAEARAYRRLFGDHLASLPVSANKASIGHVLGAAGALEAVATVIAINQMAIHPTPGVEPADPELGVDLVVGETRHLGSNPIGISTNLAFGGTNAAVVFRAWTETFS